MKDDHPTTEMAETPVVEPAPMNVDDDVLDWDAYSPPPPPKRSGTIQVRLCKIDTTGPVRDESFKDLDEHREA